MDAKCLDVWINKGICLCKLEKYEEGMKCFDKALEIGSKATEAWYNKGVALQELEKYKEAIHCYDKALEMDPEDADARNNIIYCLSLLQGT
jgi:tetratricopeptide (TPR) repeat protein